MVLLTYVGYFFLQKILKSVKIRSISVIRVLWGDGNAPNLKAVLPQQNIRISRNKQSQTKPAQRAFQHDNQFIKFSRRIPIANSNCGKS